MRLEVIENFPTGHVLLTDRGCVVACNLWDSMQRTFLWPGGSTNGGSIQPPPLVMPCPQPVLLSDRCYPSCTFFNCSIIWASS
ncbi:unnamed protein product [Nezara viridula]|uniref:Uncharacterized protein n=1 Tax=Nezara viridula TaxID=85310 RepID=A0A9P0H464_NEZVI|nr:unnamed protein product [Nezara viridula]